MPTLIYKTTTVEAIAIIAKRFPTFNSLPTQVQANLADVLKDGFLNNQKKKSLYGDMENTKIFFILLSESGGFKSPMAFSTYETTADRIYGNI